jgi:hypothetical protein
VLLKFAIRSIALYSFLIKLSTLKKYEKVRQCCSCKCSARRIGYVFVFLICTHRWKRHSIVLSACRLQMVEKFWAP